MRAVDELCAGALEPLLFGQTIALRTGAMATRVVPHALDVAVGTALHVTAQLGRAANRQRPRRAILRHAQRAAAKQTVEMLVEDLLYCDHPASAARQISLP